MANKNGELQQEQQSDGNSPSIDAGEQSSSSISETNMCGELTHSNCTTAKMTASPDLGLGIDNNDGNCSKHFSASSTPISKTDNERQNISTPTQAGGVFGAMRKSATSSAAPTQNTTSTFSFKHFLSSSSNTFTAPSTTVTSLDPICSIAASIITSTSSTTITASNESVNSSNSNNMQKSTGARPKVPQSASLAIDALCSNRSSIDCGLTLPGSSDNTGSPFSIGSTRMKRSPRFSSFDSQASLAEYVAAGSTINTNRPNRLSLHPTLPYPSNGPIASNTQHFDFQQHHDTDATQHHLSGATCAGMDLQMDNVGMQHCTAANTLPPMSSFRATARRSNQNLASNSSHKLDLPIDSVGANLLGPSDFPSASASAAALPDFVQDHWMDTLYLHDLHLNSPRNSPTRDFSGSIASAANVTWSDLGAIGGDNVCGGGGGGGGGSSGAGGDSNINSTNTSGVVMASSGSTNASGASKMLPDFLSDGPIIHSSQRLADVAAGLPSNPIGSPEDPPITSQLSNLRQENERLQRELSEARTALCEQTRRANDLERQLEDENRRRTVTPTAQQVIRLKQQLAEITEEAEILRRENETLREEGAVGGLTETGQKSDGRNVRPVSSTRSQKISQALLRAASNAENNLRQLLAGVDNLRQMAADIEGPGLRLDYEGNSDIYADFLDDCDGFDDFNGGPAL